MIPLVGSFTLNGGITKGLGFDVAHPTENEYLITFHNKFSHLMDFQVIPSISGINASRFIVGPYDPEARTVRLFKTSSWSGLVINFHLDVVGTSWHGYEWNGILVGIAGAGGDGYGYMSLKPSNDTNAGTHYCGGLTLDGTACASHFPLGVASVSFGPNTYVGAGVGLQYVDGTLTLEPGGLGPYTVSGVGQSGPFTFSGNASSAPITGRFLLDGAVLVGAASSAPSSDTYRWGGSPTGTIVESGSLTEINFTAWFKNAGTTLVRG